MKLTIFITICSTILGGSVLPATATCYAFGDIWPSTEEARSFVYHACKETNGMFTGWFAPRQIKAMCPRSGSSNLGLYFEVQNQNDHEGFDLGDDDCYQRLNNEIFGCSRGGESVVAGWRFRADPGAC